MNAFDTSGPSVILSQPSARKYFQGSVQNYTQNMRQIVLEGSSKNLPPGMIGPKAVKAPTKDAVLRMLANGPMRCYQMALELSLHRSSVSYAIDMLKSEGLVEKCGKGWKLV